MTIVIRSITLLGSRVVKESAPGVFTFCAVGDDMFGQGWFVQISCSYHTEDNCLVDRYNNIHCPRFTGKLTRKEKEEERL